MKTDLLGWKITFYVDIDPPPNMVLVVPSHHEVRPAKVWENLSIHAGVQLGEPLRLHIRKLGTRPYVLNVADRLARWEDQDTEEAKALVLVAFNEQHLGDYHLFAVEPWRK